MGDWNEKIDGNDTFLDIYENFYEQYNAGHDPIEISNKILNDYKEMFVDHDDRYNCLFALSLAQWETKCLDQKIFNEVKSIIENGYDLKLWKDKGASGKLLGKRKLALERFLKKISALKEKSKRRIKPKFEFYSIELIRLFAPDNKKHIRISEEFTNKNYIHTGGLLMWEHGGGGILYYSGQGKSISAEWIDNQTLQILHDKDIVFSKQEFKFYFLGDEVKIFYKPI